MQNGGLSESRLSLRRVSGGVMFWLCTMATLVVILLLVLVAGYLFLLGLPGIKWSLFTQDVTGDPNNPGGLRPAIVGTGILLGLASVVGVPLGLLAGVYLSEYSREFGGVLARYARFTADVLAGVPSIVIGILGYELVVAPMHGYSSGWAGAIGTRSGSSWCPSWPGPRRKCSGSSPIRSYRAGSLALGASKSQTIIRVVLPAATGSLVTGIMLAIARVAGETAPLLFTAAGN